MPREWVPEGTPEWEECGVLRARLKHGKDVHSFLSQGRAMGWQASGGRGFAFLALPIHLLTGHLKGFTLEASELLFY